ncbi:hypothetical protein [Georgenia sp. SUBG003]|uniref:hypothetical protein n=1 Tax=Georgenia sp. SUBG003 TaxID=1497974 RepID=UPI003AB69B8A
MASSDALIVGEGWISEHYFTTDATKQSFQARVLERRKAWEEIKDIGSVRTRFTQHRRWLLDQFATLGESHPAGTLREVYDRLLDVLGYRGVRAPRAQARTRDPRRRADHGHAGRARDVRGGLAGGRVAARSATPRPDPPGPEPVLEAMTALALQRVARHLTTAAD